MSGAARRFRLAASILAGSVGILGVGPTVHADDAAAGAPAKPAISLRVDRAVRVATFGGQPLGFVSGRAVAGSEVGDRVDVVFALDASQATLAASGADIDGDGRVWSGSGFFRRLFWPPKKVHADSVLASEVAAIEAVLSELDPRSTRAGVVAYAGGSKGSADNGWTLVELTSSYDRIRSGLRELLSYYVPGGSSDLPAGLRIAGIELGSARSDDSVRAQRSIVLLSEGYPRTPREPALRTEQRAIEMARRLGRRGVRVHTYAVGPLALQEPRTATQVAEQSGGRYVPVTSAGDLPNVLPKVDLAQISKLSVTHVATRRPALQVQQRPDGSYAALVPLAEGASEIEVFARASNGAEKNVRVSVDAASLGPEDQAALERLFRTLPEARRELTIEPPAPATE